MYKKYKLKQKKKKLTSYYIIILIIIFSIFSATGYALLSDNMKISGSANLKSTDKPDGEYGKSTFTWKNTNNWGSPGSYTYQLGIDITNLDEDLYANQSELEIRITFANSDFKPWDSVSSYNIWQADTITYENNVLIIKFKSESIWFPIGTVLTLYPMFCLENDNSAVIITSLSLNGKLCTDLSTETSTTNLYNSSNELETNTFDTNDSSNNELIIDSNANINSDTSSTIENSESTNNEIEKNP